MLESARARILAELADDVLVLDVGGWAVPFPRADWMLDLGAYETRGEWGYEGDPAQERFTADTWVQRDICDRQPWPFTDDQFDFAICSHTLEDVRDPVWVCAELNRVARAGYIETPSRLEEQCFGFQGPWTGWGHHHWICEPDQDRTAIDFVFKHHTVHDPELRFPMGFHGTLSEAERNASLWWTGGFAYRERYFDTPLELDAYLREFVTARPVPESPRRFGRLRGRR